MVTIRRSNLHLAIATTAIEAQKCAEKARQLRGLPASAEAKINPFRKAPISRAWKKSNSPGSGALTAEPTPK